MRVVVDSREQWTQGRRNGRIGAYFDRVGIPYTVRKLDIGDYMSEDNPYLSIDRKQNLDEVASNLLNRADSSRFWREVRRAAKEKVFLVILVEQGGDIRSINDVPKWRSKYTQITGRSLIDQMIRLEMAYGIRWVFCDKRSTGKRIVELLEGKE